MKSYCDHPFLKFYCMKLARVLNNVDNGGTVFKRVNCNYYIFKEVSGLLSLQINVLPTRVDGFFRRCLLYTG